MNRPLVTVWRYAIACPQDRSAGSRLLRRLRADYPRLRGSVSHSRTLGLVALAHGGVVGVDVEDLEAGRDVDAAAADMMSPHELQQYRSLPPVLRPMAFLRAWTAKEAVLKATGIGLALSPRTIVLRTIGVDRPELAGVPSLIGPAVEWQLAQLEAGSGRVAMLAVAGRRAPRVIYRDWSRSASRAASATTVSVGLANPAVGKTELPVT